MPLNGLYACSRTTSLPFLLELNLHFHGTHWMSSFHRLNSHSISFGAGTTSQCLPRSTSLTPTTWMPLSLAKQEHSYLSTTTPFKATLLIITSLRVTMLVPSSSIIGATKSLPLPQVPSPLMMLSNFSTHIPAC